jgi:dihydroorotate dehydrogenase electron transfer subunit
LKKSLSDRDSNKHPQNLPQTYKIANIKKETDFITTFFLKIDKIAKEAKPGQFVMVWVPGENEKPMSLAYIKNDKIGITVQQIGKTTRKLGEKKVGEYIGIRGPYGRGFDYIGVSKALIIGGGVGIAPLAPLAEKISPKGYVTAVIGAKTASDIIFLHQLEEVCENVIPVTEDGSLGIKGLLTDVLAELLKKERFDKAFMCGPEAMMYQGKKILDKFGVDGEVSLERWIKCGVGICGQCVVDSVGFRVCKEGPVFDFETIKKIAEFGKYRRLSSGIKIKIE